MKKFLVGLAKVIAILVASLLLLGVVGFSLIYYACRGETVTIARAKSEELGMEAVLERYDGGAIGDVAYVINVLPTSRNDSYILLCGDTLVFSGNKVFSPETFRLSWEKGELSVTIPRSTNVLTKLGSVVVGGRRLNIKYELARP